MWNYIITGYLIGCIIAYGIYSLKAVQEEMEEIYPIYNPRFLAALLSIMSWIVVTGAVIAIVKEVIMDVRDWINRKIAKKMLNKLVNSIMKKKDIGPEMKDILDEIKKLTKEL